VPTASDKNCDDGCIGTNEAFGQKRASKERRSESERQTNTPRIRSRQNLVRVYVYYCQAPFSDAMYHAIKIYNRKTKVMKRKSNKLAQHPNDKRKKRETLTKSFYIYTKHIIQRGFSYNLIINFSCINVLCIKMYRLAHRFNFIFR